MTMEMLNRSAVIVKPRQPYLEWARREWFEVQMSSIVQDLYLHEPLGYIQ